MEIKPSSKRNPSIKRVESGLKISPATGVRNDPCVHLFSSHEGSVLAQMAFPLHASEMSDKSETGREKHVSVPAESSHFFPFKQFLYRRSQNLTFFGKYVTKNVTS